MASKEQIIDCLIFNLNRLIDPENRIYKPGVVFYAKDPYAVHVIEYMSGDVDYTLIKTGMELKVNSKDIKEQTLDFDAVVKFFDIKSDYKLTDSVHIRSSLITPTDIYINTIRMMAGMSGIKYS